MSSKYIIFDLDDTLFFEIDFLKSGYKFICDKFQIKSEYQNLINIYLSKGNAFSYLSEKYGLTLTDLLQIYRTHIPDISLDLKTREILQWIKSNGWKLGLISDGRTITQKNKLKSLKISHLFDKIVISEEFGSEKPCIENFKTFESAGIESYYYVGDNLCKDFISPNKLGWISICLLDKGNNIHKQHFEKFSGDYLPKLKIRSLIELKSII